MRRCASSTCRGEDARGAFAGGGQDRPERRHPLLVVANGRLLGAIHLKDVVKPGIRERFAELRRLGIRTVMVTGDNPLTAAAIAAEAGVDDVIAEAYPGEETGADSPGAGRRSPGGDVRRRCQRRPGAGPGRRRLAMNDGTQAAREAANLVDLDSDPTKLLDVVQVGKGVAGHRGALTTFSIANDVAKYFAIPPALFVGIYPQLDVLNVMRLQSPQSAILSAIVFNALIIVALIPLALARRAGAGGGRFATAAAQPADSMASAAWWRRSSGSRRSTCC